MGQVTRFVGTFTITSSASTLTNALRNIEDAQSVQIYISSSVGGGFFSPQWSMYDPIAPVGNFPNVTSSTFYSQQLTLTTSTGVASILAGQTAIIQFPGAYQVRLLGTGGETSGTVCGWATKNIIV